MLIFILCCVIIVLNSSMKIFDELFEVWHAGLTGHRLFWQAVDSIPKKDIIKYATLLSETRLVRKDWFVLIQMLSVSDHWTDRQRRKVCMMIVEHWRDLSVLLELD